jgi:hypothetical protein
MSKRDYAVIADVLAHEIGEASDTEDAVSVLTIDVIARSLAIEFARLNASFDERQFLTACGLSVSERFKTPPKGPLS